MHQDVYACLDSRRVYVPNLQLPLNCTTRVALYLVISRELNAKSLRQNFEGSNTPT